MIDHALPLSEFPYTQVSLRLPKWILQAIDDEAKANFTNRASVLRRLLARSVLNQPTLSCDSDNPQSPQRDHPNPPTFAANPPHFCTTPMVHLRESQQIERTDHTREVTGSSPVSPIEMNP
jgi:hypothetical protein